MNAPSKPLQQPSALSRPFWEAAANGSLVLQRCADCGKLRHYPRLLCDGCYSDRAEWSAASGRGTIHSWTVAHHAFHPAFAAELPYVLVTVDLEEGVRALGRWRGDVALKLGLPVRGAFEKREGGVDLVFEPSGGEAETRARGAATGAEQVVAGLRALIVEAIPTARDIVFTGLVRAAGGLSRENWSLDATWVDATGAQSRRLMLMRDAAGTLLATVRAREFAVLKALEASGVPAPKAHWVDPDGQRLGAPSIVMDRMPGSCDYMVLNGERPLAARLQLAHAFIELMARIHAVDWRGRGLSQVLEAPADAPSRVELAHWQAEYRRVRLEPHPELDYVLGWMQQTAPATEAIVLVHGDFKPGNALIEDEQISAKLDWETAHLGDPLEDLGWVTNPVRKREHQIAGAWEREQIVAAYRELTGHRVDEAALRWWNVFSCWKLAVIQLTAVNEFVAGRYDRVFQTPSWLYRPMFQLMEPAA